MADKINYQKIRAHYDNALRALGLCLEAVEASIQAVEAEKTKEALYLMGLAADLELCKEYLRLIARHLHTGRERFKE